MASANNQFKSHDDARRARELEEARKAGLAPAAVDEEGKSINPHIPAYMSNAPWYLGSTAPTLRHQKDWRKPGAAAAGGGASSSSATKVAAAPPPAPRRGEKTFQATTFRKGACENCGSMSHKARDCLERPRARGAKLTGKHIAADEAVLLAPAPGRCSTSAHLVGVDAASSRSTFDGKHDRWEGYDPKDHDRVVELFEKVERAKAEAKRVKELEKRFRKKKKKENDEDDSSPTSSSDDSDEDDDEEPAAANANNDDPEGKEKLADDADAAFTKLEKRVRSAGGGASGSVRNLRIREDTAKYLLNLDPDSAYFDPKSRSMRGDPTPHVPREKKAFAGDGAFVRPSGTVDASGAGGIPATPSDYQAWASLQRHAEAAAAAGADIHVAAAPSAAEALAREHARRRAALDAATRKEVFDRYGDGGASVVRLGGTSTSKAKGEGGEGEEEEAKRLLYGASERYVEYSKKTGKPILPGAAGASEKNAATMPRSTLYDEDVFPGNHSSVWGSWWHLSTKSWGFACCHSTTKGSYCLGEAGKKAAAAAAEQLEANLRSMEERKKKKEEGGGGGGEKTTTTASLFAKHQQKQSLGASIGAGLFSEDTGASALDVGELDPEKLAAALAAEDERKRKKRAKEEEEEEERKRKEKKKKKKQKKRSSDSSGSSSSEEESDSDDDDDGGGRRRKKQKEESSFGGGAAGASAVGVPLSAEELEAYRLRRDRADDPMLRLQQSSSRQNREEGDGDGGSKGGYDFV